MLWLWGNRATGYRRIAFQLRKVISMSENDWKNDDFLAFGSSGDDNATHRDADAEAAPTKKQKRPAPTGSGSNSARSTSW